jgi:hypothetical protein
MNSEEILRAFLTDDLIIEKEYLKREEAENFKWFSHSNKKLIEVFKLAIEGETSSESPNITEKKINRLLNQQ